VGRRRLPSRATIATIWVVALAAAAVGGCILPWGSSSSGSGGGGGHADGGDLDGGQACDKGFTCFPPVGDGWKAPVAFYFGGDAWPACAAAYPKQEIQGSITAVKEDAICTPCSCDVAPCIPPTLLVYADPSCGTVTHVKGLDAGPDGPDGTGCYPFTAAYSTFGFDAQAQEIECNPAGGDASYADAALPPPFAEACSTGPLASCRGRDGVCAPALPDGFVTFCAIHEGDAGACPSPLKPYPSVYTNLVDNRGCSPCTCGPPTTDCPIGGNFYLGGSCDGGSYPIKQNDCKDYSDSIRSVAPKVESPCQPDGGQGHGSAETTDSWTICCLDPSGN
jgi:hypothetical protein